MVAVIHNGLIKSLFILLCLLEYTCHRKRSNMQGVVPYHPLLCRNLSFPPKESFLGAQVRRQDKPFPTISCQAEDHDPRSALAARTHHAQPGLSLLPSIGRRLVSGICPREAGTGAFFLCAHCNTHRVSAPGHHCSTLEQGLESCVAVVTTA